MKKLNRTDLIVTTRKKIDRIDRKLLLFLNERASLVNEIKALKKNNHLKTYDPKREREILVQLTKQNKGPLKTTEVKLLFRFLIRFFRRRQMLAKKAAKTRVDK